MGNRQSGVGSPAEESSRLRPEIHEGIAALRGRLVAGEELVMVIFRDLGDGAYDVESILPPAGTADEDLIASVAAADLLGVARAMAAAAPCECAETCPVCGAMQEAWEAMSPVFGLAGPVRRSALS